MDSGIVNVGEMAVRVPVMVPVAGGGCSLTVNNLWLRPVAGGVSEFVG